MRASVFMAGGGFARLRRRIAEIETGGAPDGTAAPDAGHEGAAPELALTGRNGRRLVIAEAGFAEETNAPALAPRRSTGPLSFGIPALDRTLAGGLRRAALHELRAAESREAGAPTGFAAAILARLAIDDERPILWVIEAAAAFETGTPYGAGLGRFGLDPKRLIVVRVARPGDALWVFEEGLRCRGLAAVVTEIRGNPRQLDLTASRRLALRAGEHGVMGLLLRQSNVATPGAASTRWLVTPRPASITDDYPAGIGHPAWRLTLERNRLGITGIFDLEWDHDRHIFTVPADAAPLPLPVAAVPLHRPPAPKDVRRRVA